MPLSLMVPADCMRILRSYRPIFLPRTIRVVVMTVMNPSPPIWMRMRITTCPKPVHLRNVSAVTNPVTQVEDVAVNSASA